MTPIKLLSSLAGLLAALCCGAPVKAQDPAAAAPKTAQQAMADSVQDSRDALNRWLETRKLIAKERRDWALDKTILTDLITVREREIAEEKERIAEARENITKADQEREELVAENEALKEVDERLKGIVAKMEERTKALLKRLPPPAKQDVERTAQLIPADPADTKQSVNNRFIAVMGTLRLLEKFNNEISLHPEVRTLEDGSELEVDTVYVGLGQGYYVTKDRKQAGVGTATPEGWVWKPQNGIAEAVGRAVDVLDGTLNAEFVRLPVEVR